MSLAPAGSVALPVTVIAVPSTRVAPMLAMLGLGASVGHADRLRRRCALPPSSSLTVSLIS